MEELVRECGFESLEEFNELINTVDLSTKDRIDEFKEWQKDDGTKSGLLTILSNRQIQEEHLKNLDEMASDWNTGKGYL